MKGFSTRLKMRALEFVLPLVLIAAYGVWAADRGDIFFPSLADIFERLFDDWLGPRLGEDIVPSLRRMFLGFFFGCGFGVIFGMILGLSRTLRLATAPLVEFFRSLPPTTLLPLVMLTLGVDDTAKVSLIALVCFFPVLLNTIAGVAGIEPGMLETARVFSIPRHDRLRHIILPGALPAIFAGLRTSLALALIMMVISEFVAASNGIGHTLWRSRRGFEIDDMWAGVILLGCLGYCLNALFFMIEKRVLAWHHGARGHRE